jgi:hypothetical protein
LSFSLDTENSTTNAPQLLDTKPKSVLLWRQDLLTLYLKIEALQGNSQTLAEQVQTLQSQLDESLTIQQKLSQSLGDSLTRLESLDQAAKARAALDQKAVAAARGENLLWASGGVLCGAVVAGMVVLLLR